jgi:small subunit ribosomal protein S2
MPLIKTANKKLIESMFNVGAHFGYSKSRRHPSATPYIFGIKNKIEIFDLEKTVSLLEQAKEFAEKIGKEGKQILLVSGKREAKNIIKELGEKNNLPYVAGRFIGGTITNFEEIQKRTARLEKLNTEKDKGLLAKYTKKERLLIDREIQKLEERFGGITEMKSKPGTVFIIDVKQEEIAVREAIISNIPIISLSSSDCDITNIKYPILGNDNSSDTIRFVLGEILDAYQEGLKNKPVSVTENSNRK